MDHQQPTSPVLTGIEPPGGSIIKVFRLPPPVGSRNIFCGGHHTQVLVQVTVSDPAVTDPGQVPGPQQSARRLSNPTPNSAQIRYFRFGQPGGSKLRQKTFFVDSCDELVQTLMRLRPPDTPVESTQWVLLLQMIVG